MLPLSQLRVFTEPQQGATYDTLLAVARRAERLGFGAFFRSDHYVAMGSALAAGGLPGPTDAWTTLAGLARDTSTIRLGTLVTSATFRHPGVLAIQVANVDEMSGGRVELGLGAGWYQTEHEAYGIPFPPTAERMARLEEQLELITGLWSTRPGEHFDHDGAHYRIVQSPALPKPVQRSADAAGVPIIVGGRGKRWTPALAARFAAEYNTPFLSMDEFAAQRQRVVDACGELGRDPASMVFSAAVVVAVGSGTTDFARRAAAIDREPGELRDNGVAGTVEEARETLQRWHDAGADRLYLQVLDLTDLEHLDLIAAMVG